MMFQWQADVSNEVPRWLQLPPRSANQLSQLTLPYLHEHLTVRHLACSTDWGGLQQQQS